MNRPNAAKASAQTQASSAHSIQAGPGSFAPENEPTANATATDTAPITMATTSLTAMYATGLSGVSRNCRLQPAARSSDTIAPPLVVASIAPYTAMLTRM